MQLVHIELLDSQYNLIVDEARQEGCSLDFMLGLLIDEALAMRVENYAAAYTDTASKESSEELGKEATENWTEIG